MKYYLESVDVVLKDLNTTGNGLSSAEAEKRLSENGKNKLEEAKKEPLIKRFFDQMKDPMIVILLVAAVINAVTDMFSTGSFKFTLPTDTFIILFFGVSSTFSILFNITEAFLIDFIFGIKFNFIFESFLIIFSL